MTSDGNLKCPKTISAGNACPSARPSEVVCGANIFDAAQFGAVGDYNPATGTGTDNTNAIQAAAAAVQRAGGGVLFFPRGNYLYRNVRIDSDNLEIYGAGATLYSSQPKTQDVVTFQIEGRKNIYIHDLTFDFTVPLDTSTAADTKNRAAGADCVRIIGTQSAPIEDVRVDHVTVYNARNSGIAINFAKRVQATNNKVIHTLGNGLIFFNNTERVLASGNIVEDTGDDMLAAGTTNGKQTAAVIFSNNSVKQGFAKGIGIFGVDRAIVTGNSIDSTWAAGITIVVQSFFGNGNNSNILVANNTIDRAGTYFGPGLYKTALQKGGDQSILIEGNTAAQNTTVKVTGNVMENGQADAIDVTAATNLELSGNTILNHPRGAGINIGNDNDKTYSTVSNVAIENNTLVGVGLSGIFLGGASAGRIAGNYIRSFNTAASTGQTVGLQLAYVESMDVENNLVINDKSGTYAYGFFRTNRALIAAHNWYANGVGAEITDYSAVAQPVLFGIQGPGEWAPQGGGGITTTRLAANSLTCAPIQVGSSRTLTGLGISVSSAGSAGSTLRFGVYSNANGRPAALLLDAGSSGLLAAGFAHTQALNLALTPGQYWLCTTAQGRARTEPVVAASAGAPVGMTANTNDPALNAFSMAGVTDSLPAKYSVSSSVQGSPYIVATMQ